VPLISINLTTGLKKEVKKKWKGINTRAVNQGDHYVRRGQKKVNPDQKGKRGKGEGGKKGNLLCELCNLCFERGRKMKKKRGGTKKA